MANPFDRSDVSLAELLPPKPITEYEGWREYVDSKFATRPRIPTAEEHAAMSDVERDQCAYERRRYHSHFPAIETPTMKLVRGEVTQLAALNYRAPPGARMGVILDGLGTLGKSTIITELGRYYEKKIRERLGLSTTENASLSTFLPVAYVTLPGNVSVKKFNKLFLRFFGIPAKSTDDEDDLSNKIVDTCNACGTSLILIDDIHFLQMKNKSAMYVNDHLKMLQSRIYATFVYAGIDVRNSGLLTEGKSIERAHASQTLHRFKMYSIRPFEIDSVEFEQVLSAFEKKLCLVKQPLGSLVKLKTYIHNRSAGFLGSINLLLREGANIAIKSGEERLTITLLKKVKLDVASEQHSEKALKKESAEQGS